MKKRTFQPAAVSRQAQGRSVRHDPTVTQPRGAGTGLLDLQRSVGNQFVQALLHDPRPRDGLVVGAADGQHEVAAERIAANALGRLGHGAARSAPAGPPSPGDLSDRFGTEPMGPDGGHTGAEVARLLTQRTGRGMRLDRPVRERFEQAFGRDLGAVRVQTGADAEALAGHLSARAFSHGNDLYFARGQYQPGSSAGDHVLAHELAHTQQSGAVVGRLLDGRTFARRATEFGEPSKTMRGIAKLLDQYHELTSGGLPMLGRLDQALDVLDDLVPVIDVWLRRHANVRTSIVLRRAALLTELRTDAVSQRLKLERARSALAGATAAARNSAPGKIRLRVDGDASSVLEKLAPVVDLAVPMPGDSTELEIDVKFPVGAGFFVGGRIVLGAERVMARKGGKTNPETGKVDLPTDTTAVSFEFAVTAGVEVGAVEITAAIGCFFEAQGSSPENALRLVAWGWYRAMRESALIPREVPNLVFGDSASSSGWERAEDWSMRIQQENFKSFGTPIAQSAPGSSATGNAYVRGGLTGEVSGEVGVGSLLGDDLSAEFSMKVSGGTHWSRRTLALRNKLVDGPEVTTKGKAIKVPGVREVEGRRGTSDRFGTKFVLVELEGKASGPLGAGASVSLELMKDQTTQKRDPDTGKALEPPKLRPTFLQIELAANGLLPKAGSSMAQHAAITAAEFLPAIVGVLRKLAGTKAGADRGSRRTMTTALAVALEDVSLGVHDLKQRLAAEPAAAKAGSETEEAEQAFETERSLEATAGLGIQFNYESGSCVVGGITLDLGFYYERGVKVKPSVVAVEVTRRRRIAHLRVEISPDTGAVDRVEWL